jgi:hypothetical protein
MSPNKNIEKWEVLTKKWEGLIELVIVSYRFLD